MKLLNVARLSRPLGCAMCGEWRGRGQPGEPAVASIAGYGLCARHLALVHAIRDDAAHHEISNRVPSSRPHWRRAL